MKNCLTDENRSGVGRPLVSVGMPIRNGAETLERAIRSIVNQSYSNLEIIISNNGSQDATDAICRQFAQQDQRISYFQQPRPLTAIENFRFVFEQAHGQYFMWAAHDDWRTENYIETLLNGFEQFPDASVVISEVVAFHDVNDLTHFKSLDYRFHTAQWPLLQKIRKSIASGCHHLYGLIQARYLRGYNWYDLVFGPDRPLLLALLTQGDFAYVPGARLYIWKPQRGKSDVQRARDNAYSALVSFPLVRLAWYSALAIKHADAQKPVPSLRMPQFILFPIIFLFYALRKNTMKSYLFRTSPGFLRRRYRRWKDQRWNTSRVREQRG